MGRENEDVTHRYFQKISDEEVPEIFKAFDDERNETTDDMELMLRYHEHDLDKGTPEFERAKRLVSKRTNGARTAL